MIIFLIPPSEWKLAGGSLLEEHRTHDFEKPLDIAVNASPKDLKCQWNRYEEWIALNKAIATASVGEQFMPAIERYSGVMFKAIDYAGMTESGRTFFDQNFLIISGLYGLVAPQDAIANYKLPIDTKWLRQRWWAKLTNKLQEIKPDIIVDLLPWSYKKVINFSEIDAKVIQVDFYTVDIENSEKKKLTHGVKKVKGERIKEVCESEETIMFTARELCIEVIR